jgi:hypothetical protein
VCLVVGGVAVFGFRLAHGDLPAGDPEAALRFITGHPFYAGVHLGAIAGVVVWVGGLVALSATLGHPFGSLLGRLAMASVLLGAAVFITDFSIDGVAGQDLASAWATAPAPRQAELVHAAEIAFRLLRGTSLTSILLLWGVPLLLLGRALRLEGYPAWLGGAGVVVGVATAAAAITLVLAQESFPGVLLYGLLVEVAQLWSVALGIVMWRRSRSSASG